MREFALQGIDATSCTCRISLYQETLHADPGETEGACG